MFHRHTRWDYPSPGGCGYRAWSTPRGCALCRKPFPRGAVRYFQLGTELKFDQSIPAVHNSFLGEVSLAGQEKRVTKPGQTRSEGNLRLPRNYRALPTQESLCETERHRVAPLSSARPRPWSGNRGTKCRGCTGSILQYDIASLNCHVTSKGSRKKVCDISYTHKTMPPQISSALPINVVFV